jgi:hypothetical protein
MAAAEERGWSWQKQSRRAIERDEEAIAKWFGGVAADRKGAWAKRAWIVFEDESGITAVGRPRFVR